MPLTAINADESARVSVCRFGFVQEQISEGILRSRSTPLSVLFLWFGSTLLFGLAVSSSSGDPRSPFRAKIQSMHHSKIGPLAGAVIVIIVLFIIMRNRR
jgi:hypothetical protein